LGFESFHMKKWGGGETLTNPLSKEFRSCNKCRYLTSYPARS
jgi:hypothetical protein